MTADRSDQCDISVLLTPSGFVTPCAGRDASAVADASDGGLRLELARNSGAPGQARRALAQHFGGRVRPIVIADAQLVVSELVSNAVEHGIGDLLTITAGSSGDTLSVSVSSRCRVRDLRKQPDWDLPAPSQICGRGLPIVSTLAMSTPQVESSPDGAFHNQVTVTAELTTDDSTV